MSKVLNSYLDFGLRYLYVIGLLFLWAVLCYLKGFIPFSSPYWSFMFHAVLAGMPLVLLIQHLVFPDGTFDASSYFSWTLAYYYSILTFYLSLVFIIGGLILSSYLSVLSLIHFGIGFLGIIYQLIHTWRTYQSHINSPYIAEAKEYFASAKKTLKESQHVMASLPLADGGILRYPICMTGSGDPYASFPDQTLTAASDYMTAYGFWAIWSLSPYDTSLDSLEEHPNVGPYITFDRRYFEPRIPTKESPEQTYCRIISERKSNLDQSPVPVTSSESSVSENPFNYKQLQSIAKFRKRFSTSLPGLKYEKYRCDQFKFKMVSPASGAFVVVAPNADCLAICGSKMMQKSFVREYYALQGAPVNLHFSGYCLPSPDRSFYMMYITDLSFNGRQLAA